MPDPLHGHIAYLGLPGSTWICLWAMALQVSFLELDEADEDPLAQRAPWVKADDASHLAAPAIDDQQVAEGDEVQAALFQRVGFTPAAEDLTLARSLVLVPERDRPKAVERLLALLQGKIRE